MYELELPINDVVRRPLSYSRSVIDEIIRLIFVEISFVTDTDVINLDLLKEICVNYLVYGYAGILTTDYNKIEVLKPYRLFSVENETVVYVGDDTVYEFRKTADGEIILQYEIYDKNKLRAPIVLDSAVPLYHEWYGFPLYKKIDTLLQDADAEYTRSQWDLEAKEPAIHVTNSALIDRDGKPFMPQGRERLYRKLNTRTSNSGDMFEIYSPDIFAEEHKTALNEILRRIEFNANLTYGTLSDETEVSGNRTAESVRSSKARSFYFIQTLQTELQNYIESILTSFNALNNTNISFSVQFGDGILTDNETTRKLMFEDVVNQILPKEEYLRVWYPKLDLSKLKEDDLDDRINEIFRNVKVGDNDLAGEE